MINSDNLDPKDEGKKVWLSLSDQLLELKAFVSSMLASIGSYVFRNKWLFLLLPLLGAALGFGGYMMQQESFDAAMTVSYVHLEKKIYADMLERVNQAIENEDLASMDGFENLSPEAMNSMISLSSTNIKGEPLLNDLSTEKVPFNIHFKITKTDYLAELGEAVVAYLNSPDFVQDRIKYNESKATDQIAFYKALMATQKNELENLDGVNSDTYAALISAISDSRRMINEAQAQLAFNKNIEPLHDLSKSSAVHNESGKRFILFGLVIGFILAAGVSLFRS